MLYNNIHCIIFREGVCMKSQLLGLFQIISHLNQPHTFDIKLFVAFVFLLFIVLAAICIKVCNYQNHKLFLKRIRRKLNQLYKIVDIVTYHIVRVNRLLNDYQKEHNEEE